MDRHPVLDILAQRRRNTRAAKQCFRKLLTWCPYVPRVIIADTLKSYRAAKREILPGVERRYRNNRCEHLNRPTRQREQRHAGVQVSGACQAILVRVWPHCPTLPPQTA